MSQMVARYTLSEGFEKGNELNTVAELSDSGLQFIKGDFVAFDLLAGLFNPGDGFAGVSGLGSIGVRLFRPR
jgi:hypothetical protein